MTTTNPPPPKRRPYNASGSLSEYGVFPECDAQQPTEDADAVSAGGWYQGGDRTCGPNATTFRFIRDDNGIVAFVEGSRDVAMKRAARIVECVNACTGIADPAAFIRLAKQAGAAQQQAAMEFEGTDREVLREFIRICREHKPVGQWPGERVCKAIERAMDNEKPFRFIAEEDMAPEREPSMKDADRMLSGPRRAAGHLDRKRFERAPCYLCGYNGEGYYQPDKHPCAARYHAQQPAAEPRSTHRAWRRNDWLLSYFEALSDHHIGCEQQPAAVDNEENQRTWQALWLVLNQTGTVVVPGSDIVSADWSRCQIEQTVHESTGAVQFRAILLPTQQGGSDNGH